MYLASPSPTIRLGVGAPHPAAPHTSMERYFPSFGTPSPAPTLALCSDVVDQLFYQLIYLPPAGLAGPHRIVGINPPPPPNSMEGKKEFLPREPPLLFVRASHRTIVPT